LDNISLRARSRQHDTTLHNYVDLLRRSLKVGFRLAGPGRDQPAIPLGYISHDNRIFEAIFSSNDGEVIADAVCTWIADCDVAPPGSFVRYLTKRLGNEKPLSRRLQWASTRSIEDIKFLEFVASELETTRLLNRLEVSVDDMVEKGEWITLLVFAIRFIAGQGLSSHHWHLLEKLVSDSRLCGAFPSFDVQAMKSLEQVGNWESLEVWMWILWKSLGEFDWSTPEWMRDIEETNLKLLLHRPSAIPRFEDLCRSGLIHDEGKVTLRRICDQVKAGKLPSESSPSLYVSVFTFQRRLYNVLMPPPCLALANRFTHSHSFPFVLREMTLSKITTVYTIRGADWCLHKQQAERRRVQREFNVVGDRQCCQPSHAY